MLCIDCHILPVVEIHHFIRSPGMDGALHYVDTMRCYPCSDNAIETVEMDTPVPSLEMDEEQVDMTIEINLSEADESSDMITEEPVQETEGLILCTECHHHKHEKSFCRNTIRKDENGVQQRRNYYTNICHSCYTTRSQKRRGYITDDPNTGKKCIRCKVDKEQSEFPPKRVYKKKYTSPSGDTRSAICHDCQLKPRSK